MAVKVGINGFGRIGRMVFQAIADQGLLGKVDLTLPTEERGVKLSDLGIRTEDVTFAFIYWDFIRELERVGEQDLERQRDPSYSRRALEPPRLERGQPRLGLGGHRRPNSDVQQRPGL